LPGDRFFITTVSVSTPSRAVQNELRMLTVEEFASAWLSDDRLCWGLGPFLALNIGFWSTATLFEIAILFSWCSLIEYSTERPRRECLKGEPSTKQHLKESTLTLVGPAAVSTVCLLSRIGPILMPGPYHWEHSLVETGLKFLAMMFIHDFLLYSIHRLLHESEFLFHHVHAVSSWCTYAAESVSGSDIIR